MLINLTKSVPLKELCKITVAGHMAYKAQCIEFTLSQEAIIGFATELLWLYEDISDNRKLIIETNQLKTDPAPNQSIGFYLTPDSPMLVLKVNSLTENKDKGYIHQNWKEINIKDKNVNQYYNVKNPYNNDIELITLESYELSRRNIMNISIFDVNGNNITKTYNTVTFEINYTGIKDFATMLLVWANNCNEGDEYALPHIDKLDYGYNLGIILTYNNIPVKFKYHNLGTAFDYDSRF